MEKRKAIIKYFIIFLVLIVIGILIMIFIIKNNNVTEEQSNKNNNIVSGKIENKISRVKDSTEFFTVSNCISKYLNKNVNNNLSFVALKMNVLEGSNVNTYSVYGFYTDVDYKKYNYLYLIVKLDQINSTFEVERLDNNYDDIDDVKLNNEIITINKKEDNNFEHVKLSEGNKIRKYIDCYKIMALSNPELLYNEFLNEEYKNNKFENIENFKNYINNNREKILGLSAIEYKIDKIGDYKQYKIKDNNNNTLVIKEKYIMNFSIMLDNYTIEDDEYKTKYNNASDRQKIETNISKIFKMIDNKEYKALYDNYINEDFKNNKFPNYEIFIEYITNNFFEYNYLGTSSIQKEGDNYLITINYKDGISSAAEERIVKIIMLLKNENKFEISFAM